MKSGTTELMKFKRLQRSLGESVRGTVGLLEMLWTGTAKNCPEGDVGRFSDEEIAIMCDWDGDPIVLVNALTNCGWLDACDSHRLIVHDWVDHCPQFVKGFMSKHGRQFAKQCAKQPARDVAKQPTIAPCHSSVPPYQALPSQAKSNQTKSSLANATRPKFVVPTVDEIRAYCDERRNSIDPDRFFDHYQANGWVQGRGKPIRDWKAAVRYWESNDIAFGGKSGQPPPEPAKPTYVPLTEEQIRATMIPGKF